MMKLKCFGGAHRLRSMSLAGFLFVAGCFGFGPVLAAGESKSDGVQEGAKSIESGFGGLLKGMGQEMKKILGSEDAAAKKDGEQKSKPAEKESSTDKEKPK